MRATFQSATKDRAYLVPIVIGALLVVALFIMGIAHIRISELQVPVRYSSFGITNFYREQWFYQIAFMLFGVLLYVFHMAISIKLLKQKGREFGIAFQWLTVALLVITVITVAAIFQVAQLI